MHWTKEKLEKYEVVSFDIFDTLIQRSTGKNPKAVFAVLEEVACGKYGNEYLNFETIRVNAEKEAREKSNKEEISIFDIYQCISIERKEEILELEKHIEIDLSNVNPEVMEIFDACVDMKKKIFITSDMYLDAITIETILEKSGVEYPYTLLLSSEQNCTKQSGKLFRQLLNMSQVAPNKVLHIGDNWKRDFYCAKKEGLDAWLYSSSKVKDDNTSVQERCLFGNMPMHFDADRYWKQIGQYVLGNFLFGYSNWLVKNFKEMNYDHIFFLSRDGWIMKGATDILGNNEIIYKSSYLYASRRSLIVPTLHMYSSYEEKCQIMFWKKHFSLVDFLWNFGLDIDDVKDQLLGLIPNLDMKFERSELLNNPLLRKVYKFFEENINTNSIVEYELLVKYLRQEEFSGKVAIVDSGWFGNLQNALQKIAAVSGIDVEINGYYIGVRKECQYYDSQKMNGFLYFNSNNAKNEKNEIRANDVVEAFHSHDEGSVLKYEDVDGLIQPVLMERDFSDEKIIILNSIQESALERIKFLSSLKEIKFNYLPPESFFKGFYRVGVCPDLTDAWEIGRFVENEELHNTLYYSRHPNRLKSDVYKLRWKLGQLKRVLKLNLDYNALYDLLDR